MQLEAATLIQLLYDRAQDDNDQWPRAVAQLDTNAFNAISREATFDSVTGTASNVCDNGNIQPAGAAILSFPEMKPFFPNVKSMLSTSNLNRNTRPVILL